MGGLVYIFHRPVRDGHHNKRHRVIKQRHQEVFSNCIFTSSSIFIVTLLLWLCRISPSSTTPDEAVRKRFPQILSCLALKTGIHTIPFTRNCLSKQLDYIRAQPIPQEVLDKALILATITAPLQCLEVAGVYYFNRKSHCGVPVTVTRVDEYKKLVAGGQSNSTNSSAEVATPLDWFRCKNALSLHAVVSEVHKDETVMFRCDCKLFYHSGYLCSHSLAARHMHYEHTIDLIRMTQPLPATKKVGRKRKNAGALTREENTVTTVKVKVVHLNDMTPIVNPISLMRARVFDKATNDVYSITGYSVDTNQYTITSCRQQDNTIVWSEAELRQGLHIFEKFYL